ncbi:hypothetical protein Tco_0790775 [Tanacetum coccineum]
MDSMHSTLSMYYDYDAHVKGGLLVMMKNSQSVNLLIFISNTLIELFNDFGSDRDGIPKRPTMYLNLWSNKVVRHRLVKTGKMNGAIHTESYLFPEHAEFDESDTHVLERFDTLAGNPVKEILLKLSLPDHRILKDGGEGRKADLFEDKQIPSVGVFDEVFLALGWHLEEIHVTWAQLEKKRTRLRLYTKNHEELCKQRVETASPSQSDGVRIFIVTALKIQLRRQDVADLKRI